MPAGPATGRVGATRRALTAPSTAPASLTRWWSARSPDRTRTATSTQRGPSAKRAPRCFAGSLLGLDLVTDLRRLAGAIVLQALDTRSSTRGEDTRWRERPRPCALGSGAGQHTGVVHAIVSVATPGATCSDEAADSAASPRQAWQHSLRQAFACGAWSWPARGERGAGEGTETRGLT